jgi:hypothetical protein
MTQDKFNLLDKFVKSQFNQLTGTRKELFVCTSSFLRDKFCLEDDFFPSLLKFAKEPNCTYNVEQVYKIEANKPYFEIKFILKNG